MGERLIILRCCQDWPCHWSEAFLNTGRCGKCGQVPEIVDEPYSHPRKVSESNTIGA